MAFHRKDLSKQVLPMRLRGSSNSYIRDDYVTVEHHKSEVLASLLLLDHVGRLSLTSLSRSVPSSFNIVITSISTSHLIILKCFTNITYYHAGRQYLQFTNKQTEMKAVSLKTIYSEERYAWSDVCIAMDHQTFPHLCPSTCAFTTGCFTSMEVPFMEEQFATDSLQ